MAFTSLWGITFIYFSHWQRYLLVCQDSFEGLLRVILDFGFWILDFGFWILENPPIPHFKTDISASMFLDVNLRSPWWNLNIIKSLLKQASSLKLNEEELSLFVTEEKDINRAVSYLFSTYPLNNIILTKGKAGAISFTKDNITEQISPSQNATVIDTVGAGDAFCSVLILGMLKNWDISTTLKKAQEFASAIVGIQGTTTNDKSFYASF